MSAPTPPEHAVCVGHALAAVAAVHTYPGRLSVEQVTEEDLADVIADLLHLAAAADLDVEEVLDHGRRYFEGDLTDPGHICAEDARPARHLAAVPTPAEEL